MNERIYTPRELAEQLSVSTRSIQDLFRHEAGVLRIGNTKDGRRQRSLIRIPQSVVDRVFAGKVNR